MIPSDLNVPIPTPAVSFIGRKNSGKTTLLEKLISSLTNRGLKVATVKHHGHPDFDIDIPGRDSFRHRAAGAQSTTILSDVRFAQVTELTCPLTCEAVLASISHYDITLVEGFKQAAVPHIELFRAENPRDVQAAQDIGARWQHITKENNQYTNKSNPAPCSLGSFEFTSSACNSDNITSPFNHAESLPVAVVTNMPTVQQTAQEFTIPCFDFEDIDALSHFIETNFVRPKLSIVVQAGGESKRMGAPKDMALLREKPLIQYVLERTHSLADELIVTTNNPKRLSFLKDIYPNIRFVGDLLEERGAIPSFYTALSAAQHDLVGIVACDMVEIPCSLLAIEALLLRPCIKPSYDAILPKTEIWLEPFAGVYKKEPCFTQIKKLVTNRKENTSLHDLIDELNYGLIDCTSNKKRARFGGSFCNINTPQDLEIAERDLFRDSECIV